MNKSIDSFNFDATIPDGANKESPELYLIETDDNVPMLLNEHIVVPKSISNDKPKPRKSYVLLYILLLLNIIAIVLYYFRNDIILLTPPLVETSPTYSIPVPETTEVKQIDNNKQTKDHSRIVSDVLTDLVNVEKTQKINAGKKVKPEKLFTKHSRSSSNAPVKKHQTASVKPAPKKPSIVPTVGITGNDIRDILNTFVKAYSDGDTEALLSLFWAENESSQRLQKIQSNVETLFANTEARKLKLEDLIWRYQDDKTIGRGKFLVSVDLSNGKGQQSIDAEITLILKKSINKYYIDSVQLANIERTVSNVTVPSLPLNPTTTVAMPPSKDELQFLVKQYVGAYEKANMEAMSELFATNAVTNTRIGFEEIKQDYMQLFGTSSNRRIFLKGLSWIYDKNHAKGTGKLDVFVTGADGEIDHIIKGKIKIIAKRQNDTIVITHLYHSENK